MADDPFEIWLGMIGRDRRATYRIIGAINRAGRMRAWPKASGFAGTRTGRGAGVGAMLSSPHYSSGANGRRAIVKVRIVPLGVKGLSRAKAHLRYLQREGTTREGERGTLYGRELALVDGDKFLERGKGDRHHFRFVVSPEDGGEYPDLKPLVRRWMKQVEDDLGSKLDWVAVDHFNTGHPHAHVILRGKDDRGQDLVIAPNYLARGLRARVEEIVDIDLGPRSPAELSRAAHAEIDQERLTAIDRRLLKAIGSDRLVSAVHRDISEQTLRAGRLQTLGRMGLAVEETTGIWRLDRNLAGALRRMGERGDIMRTMRHMLADRLPERSPEDYQIYAAQSSTPLIGKLIVSGLSDEHADRRYIIVDGVDGNSHYIDLGAGTTDAVRNSLVRVTIATGQPRAVDRTLAQIAGMHDGRYSAEMHLMDDLGTSEAFAQTHVRRLEEIRRAVGCVEQQADGSWMISCDYLEQVAAFERQKAERQPVRITALSDISVEQLVRSDGATWLDRELVATYPTRLGRGFGADVAKALDARRRWLIEQGLADVTDGLFRPAANLLEQLGRRELRQIAAALAKELGLCFAESPPDEMIAGILRKAVAVGGSKFALIEKSHEFTLVPWRPEFDEAIGREVCQVIRAKGVSWTIADRGRSGPSLGMG